MKSEAEIKASEVFKSFEGLPFQLIDSIINELKLKVERSIRETRLSLKES